MVVIEESLRECNGKSWSSSFSSLYPHLLASLVTFTSIPSAVCPCYLASYISRFPHQLFLSSFSPSFPLSHFLLSFLTFRRHFFHYFIPFFTSSSLSLPLFLSLLPPRLLVSLPKARRPVRSHPLPRKQGLKFKAAVVDWQQEREHRRGPAWVKTDLNIVLNRWNFNLIRHHSSVSVHVITCELD